MKFIKLYIKNFFLDVEAGLFFVCGIAMALVKIFDTRCVSIIPFTLYCKLLLASWVLFILKEHLTDFRVAKYLEEKENRRSLIMSYLGGTILIFSYFFFTFQRIATEPDGSIYRQLTIIMFVAVCFMSIRSVLSRKRDWKRG